MVSASTLPKFEEAAFWFTFAWMVVGDVDPLPESYQSLLPLVRFVVACATVAVIAAPSSTVIGLRG
ncbi:hypothetical protein HCU74_00150 [Spongiibacter sp. KMU-166]|uniref:Ion channel n=1 Tax=Spongiibacter thalassae TaxID=2721624 RepID=A0ABX1GC32_9GAMM|nr:hypothetical protein [Spongiibacter thalassae]NKI15819.1 hypothetical protein [Spongiibacter thalassae]